MPNRVRVLAGSDADRVELARRVRAKGSPAREVERARIVLLAAEGVPGQQIAARVGCSEPTALDA
ncbi:MAG: helix-turn-helix domain-containing protein [Cellulomonas sp.]|uniref:helix-turn-helix domain-containing protein n=1 Tax=Cellulomonas sp. TaxID=40001 RepID=UPI0018388BB0|nr:helix-turn-helix domain-containing protein [Cellulomonas sp.]NMM31274.1 helix-turn-helix domain-containing protein [Cellulomonas sp.]